MWQLRPVVKIAAFGLLLFFLAASAASAQITGSKHDLRTFGGGAVSETCVFCHTPHNAQTAVPLWNRGNPSTSGYTMYSSSSMDAATVTAPDGSSLMCLSCHDGTIAVDSYGGNTGSHPLTSSNQTVGGLLSKDLSNDHPVSIVYNTALATADGALYDPATQNVTDLGGTIAVRMLDGSSKVQCASCHNAHRTTFRFFLRMSNNGSALCLACHMK